MFDPLYFGPRCPFCGVDVSVKQFHDHMLWNHPEYLNLERKKGQDSGRAFGGFALLAVLILVGGIALLVFTPVPLLPAFAALFAAMIVVMILGVVYAHRATQADTQAINALERHCQICDAEMAGSEMGAHIQATHPAEATYLREAKAYAIGSLAVAIVVMIGLGVLLVLYATPDSTDIFAGRGFARTVAGGGLLIWGGMMYVWKRFVDTRHVMRVRRAWERSHPSSVDDSRRT